MSLSRFHDAQQATHSGFDAALAELRAGRKRTHWIWYVFPQLRGLGHSPAAEFYGLNGVTEAEQYLHDARLRANLLLAASTVKEQLEAGVSLDELMGARIDALKLVSSMTLFGAIARRFGPQEESVEAGRLADVADAVLGAAARTGYRPCTFTLDALRAAP